MQRFICKLPESIKMKKILTFIILVVTLCQAALANPKTIELELTESYISSLKELNDAWVNFEKEFKEVESKMGALKSIDDALKIYEKYEKSFQKYHTSKNEKIAIATRKYSSLLYDLISGSYKTMGELANKQYDKKNLKKDCSELLKRNKKIIRNARYIVFDFCSILTLKEAESDKQYSVFTVKERNSLNDFTESIFGKNIKEGQKSKSDSSFEYFAKILYEFINIEWIFKEE